MAIDRARICYILPEYDAATSSHFFHLYELLERASSALDIFVVVEKSRTCPSLKNIRVRCQKFSWMPARIVELFLVLVVLRLGGYRAFYTHYSFVGACISWIVSRLSGGRNFYWNCGMPWLYRRGWFEEAVFRFLLRHSLFVTGTPGLSRAYRERYGLDQERLRVVPNWVNVERFLPAFTPRENRLMLRRRLGIPENGKVILFAHRLSRRKGTHHILPIAASVTKKNEHAIFLIVGAGPDLESLKSQVKSLKLEEQVRLVGEVPNREIQDYFAIADVFLMPSEEEGFPHVLLEAMAAGLPYTASDVGGVREITPAELQEYIVSQGDNINFEEKIIKLLTLSPHDRENIAEAEKKWVKQYDIHVVLPRFISLFKTHNS